ncbi:hypothetical protein AMECASPLE_039432 [Ameca splendens]|uniref:Ubiquitin-like protease family profile domain-containing protein n=1 Tax=Ameca splendens TaxID=208324 RepID=A0ABV0Z825_9TELE
MTEDSGVDSLPDWFAETFGKWKDFIITVILGINNRHNHWTLVVIYPQDKRSLFLDPLGESKQDIQKWHL